MKVNLELQYFEGCPNHAKMKHNVSEAIRGIEDRVYLVETTVEDEMTAMRLKFRGSPTLLINGEDVEGLALPAKGSHSCRLYPHGIPSVQAIRQKIDNAYKKGGPL